MISNELKKKKKQNLAENQNQLWFDTISWFSHCATAFFSCHIVSIYSELQTLWNLKYKKHTFSQSNKND